MEVFMSMLHVNVYLSGVLPTYLLLFQTPLLAPTSQTHPPLPSPRYSVGTVRPTWVKSPPSEWSPFGNNVGITWKWVVTKAVRTNANLLLVKRTTRRTKTSEIKSNGKGCCLKALMMRSSRGGSVDWGSFEFPAALLSKIGSTTFPLLRFIILECACRLHAVQGKKFLLPNPCLLGCCVRRRFRIWDLTQNSLNIVSQTLSSSSLSSSSSSSSKRERERD